MEKIIFIVGGQLVVIVDIDTRAISVKPIREGDKILKKRFLNKW